ncbi:hypothetical protein [Tenacibaculum litopenaei]|uniref:hypothetical protein n=1 Tax=Tenacibaculum litopenaei TaxID=396016 RepID=UPI0038B454EF
MKTLKTIIAMIALFTLTTACTDMSEDLTLQDKIKNELPATPPPADDTTTPPTPGFMTGEDGSTDNGGKG